MLNSRILIDRKQKKILKHKSALKIRHFIKKLKRPHFFILQKLGLSTPLPEKKGLI